MDVSRKAVLASSGRVTKGAANETLRFMAVTWHASDDTPGCDDDSSSDEDSSGDITLPKKKPFIAREFVVKVFGVTQFGGSVCLSLTGFMPYFYVKVDPSWGAHGGSRLKDWLSRGKGNGWRVASTQLISRKDYVGFHNGDTCEFVRVKFFQNFAMRQMSKRLISGKDVDGRIIDLRSIGVSHSGGLAVYESNIDPLLRLMHHRSIAPAGWVEVESGCWSHNETAQTTCERDVQCAWTDLCGCASEGPEIAPMIVLSLDIECGSSHGDFPQAKKGPSKLGMEMAQLFVHSGMRLQNYEAQLQAVVSCLHKAFGLGYVHSPFNASVSRLFPKNCVANFDSGMLPNLARDVLSEIKLEKTAIERVTQLVTRFLPCPRPVQATSIWGAAVPEPAGCLEGDPVIQIGVTMHVYGDKECCQRHILTLGSCDTIAGTIVHEFGDERALLLGFTELIQRCDPDMLIGYNQLGFDFAYLNGRAEELGIAGQFAELGRMRNSSCPFKKHSLSSSALGDNEYRYFDIIGRCQIDIMKVVQREHKLDSYKLDAVADHFMGMHKNSITPNDIFRLQLGSSADRRIIAEYCVQDCALCNHLLMRLEIVANNVAMANVCSVPLSFIFLRGQGIKVLSLVAKRCLAEGFLIPTLQSAGVDVHDGYEGAIVLEPMTGMYLTEPVCVLDFASLYPSSMISGNLSHDTFITDPRYDNLPGISYGEVRYDVKDAHGNRVREEVCRFAKSTCGILPLILKDLLLARKATRARIKGMDGTDPFMLAVLDGQQVAFKVTANSLYGQMGAQTSALYLKQLAACTTSIGRSMIMQAKLFLESAHGARVIYGDTDSVFAIFPNIDPTTGVKRVGKAALAFSIQEGINASIGFRSQLQEPHDLEYEKTFFPFFLLSKKRYVGKKFVTSIDSSEVSSMGLVTKRRDNAPIVKFIYGGLIDILLERQDVRAAESFLAEQLLELVDGKVDMQQLVVSKALKGFYKAPDTIAHYVLARRMGERDPGNKPQVNDRVPYVYIVAPRRLLQGDRIENPSYARENRIPIDTTHYVTNQIMKPVVQLMALALEMLSGYTRSIAKGLHEVSTNGGNVAVFREGAVQRLLFDSILANRTVTKLEKARCRLDHQDKNKRNKQSELTSFFQYA